MDPVGLGKDVLVCSSQRSGIDVVHVSSMKSCFVSVESDVVMCFGSVGVCMTPPPYSNLLGQ